MKRREFIALLGGAAAWPVAARGQQPERVRRVGVLMNLAADDPEGQVRMAAFRQGLSELGWVDGGNMRIDTRWGAGDVDRYRRYAAELVAPTPDVPDVIVAVTSTVVAALQRETRSVPIVFVSVIDPVGAGLVTGLARPGGNTTGFTVFEYGLSPKWLALLKEIAPRVTRAAVFRDPTQASHIGMLGGMQSVAPSLRMELSLIDSRDAGEIERAIAAFAREPNGGQIWPTSGIHRQLIITLAARHRLPTVYTDREFVTAGGLTSYGPNRVEPYRQAAGYVDRILKGEKPGDLPVQAPTKIELAINLKTANALGLEIPPTLLARADEVIE